MRPARECLRDCPDLAGVDERSLEQLAAVAVQFSLPAGNLLFESGAPSEGIFLLVSGRLAVKITGIPQRVAEIEGGQLVGEAGWLLNEPRGASLVALRDSELMFIANPGLDAAAAGSPSLALALARLSARRLRRSNRQDRAVKQGRVIVIVPNNEEVDVAEVATRLVAELARGGSAELVWDVRASKHALSWFNRIEELNDYVVYVADSMDSAWTRQCCRQADVILLAAGARALAVPWPGGIADSAAARGVRVELALIHEGSLESGAAARWLGCLPPTLLPTTLLHHIIDATDFGRLARLLTRRGVGLVLSGGGARGFAHLGIIQALREARIPIDFVGGSSIGAVFAAGVAMGWSDEEMRSRYRRGFVESNPVNDYTFPLVALTRGRKVSRLLRREYGDVSIEDLRTPFFCVSSNLTTGRAVEHRAGAVADALRASVAIPGVMPPVFWNDDVLVDGAAINNLPVDVMQRFGPGIVIGSDVGADRVATGQRRVNIVQILMDAGMVNTAASAAAQRALADVLFKPPLGNVELLDWQAFDHAIEAGYRYAIRIIEQLADLPRLAAPTPTTTRVNSLQLELERRLAAEGRS